MQSIRNLSNSTSWILIFYTMAIVMVSRPHGHHRASCSIDGSQVKYDLISDETVSQEQQHPKEDQLKHKYSFSSTKEHLSNPTSTANQLKQTRHKSLGEIQSKRSRCSMAERELDRCSAQLIGLGHSSGSVYPDSMQQLNSVYCPKFRETVICIKNSSECYTPFERQIINWVLTSTRKMNYKRCKNENDKFRFLNLTNSCFSSMQNPMDECMSHYIGSLDAIADYNRELERLSEDDFQIQLSCCANRSFKQCIMNSAKQKCQAHENIKKLRRTNSNSSQRVARMQLLRVVQDTMDDLRSTLDEMALTGPGFICKNIDEKFCKSRFDGRYTNRSSRHMSIVPAMVKIYANK